MEQENIAHNSSPDQFIGDKFPELQLDMKDEELLALDKKYSASGDKASKNMEEKGKENVDYWRGESWRHNNWVVEEEDRRQGDNRIFSGVETALPIICRESVDPIITGNKTEIAELIAKKVRKELIRLLDLIGFKIKNKRTARYWMFYHLGVKKVIWNKDDSRIDIRVIKPKNLIFQFGSSIDEGKYTGEFIGEYITDKTAKEVKELFPNAQAIAKIDDFTKKNDGTIIKYKEWNTSKFTFWVFEGIILDKIKNKDWNYDEEVPSFDAAGQPTTITKPAVNHFKEPQMMYSFFSVYNTGESVYDITGLIDQAKKPQDTINDRIRQIAQNVKNQNNSVNFYGLDEQKARTAYETLNKGGFSCWPGDKENYGMERVGGNQLAGDVYQELNIARESIDGIFGVNAVTRGEQTSDQTVRGKIISKQADIDRISFIVEHLEQDIDRTLNLMVQMMYVHYDTPIPANDPEAVQKDELAQAGELEVGIKDGSLLPKDPLSQANQATDMFNEKALGLLGLYERLDIENPKQEAINTILFNADPMTYLTQVLDYQPPQPTIPPQQPGMPDASQGGQPPMPAGNPIPGQPQDVPHQALPPPTEQPQNLLNQVPIQ